MDFEEMARSVSPEGGGSEHEPHGGAYEALGHAHTAAEFFHAAHEGGGHGGVGPVEFLSPFAIWNGIKHTSHAMHEPPAEVDGALGKTHRVIDAEAGFFEAISGGVGTTAAIGAGLTGAGATGLGAGLTRVASQMGPAAAVLGAFSGGWMLGGALDDAFGISDSMSGTTGTEHGNVQSHQRGVGGIADANQRYFDQSLHRLRAAEGSSIEATVAQAELAHDDADPQLMAAARATLAMQHSAEQAEGIRDKLQAKARLNDMFGHWVD